MIESAWRALTVATLRAIGSSSSVRRSVPSILCASALLRRLRRGRERGAAAEAGGVVEVGRLVGVGDVLAAGPELLVGAEEAAHEHAVALLPTLVLALDGLGLEAGDEVLVDGVAHPLVEVADHVVGAGVAGAL